MIVIPKESYIIEKVDGSEIGSEDWVDLKNELLGIPRNPSLRISRLGDHTLTINIGASASLNYIGMFEEKLEKLNYKII